jgi:hypothetical protein
MTNATDAIAAAMNEREAMRSGENMGLNKEDTKGTRQH